MNPHGPLNFLATRVWPTCARSGPRHAAPLTRSLPPTTHLPRLAPEPAGIHDLATSRRHLNTSTGFQSFHPHPRPGQAPRRYLSTLPSTDSTSSSSPSDEPTINLSFRTLSSLLITSAVGLLLGSLSAMGLSHALEATGVFAYVDEDDEGDSDADEGQVDDGNANVVMTNVDLAFHPSEVQVVGKGGEEEESPPLLGVMAHRLALEATGDLTLSATVNLHRWDPAARAFQLMQLKSFLHALDDALHTTQPDGTLVPIPLDEDTAKEVAAIRAFARGTIERIETRLKSELVARPPDSTSLDEEGN